MKRLFTIVLFTMFWVATAAAQDFDFGQLSRDLQQLEDRIAQIKLLAQRYQNERAIEIINRSQIEFAMARNFMEMRRLREARQRFAEAKKLMEQAARLILFKPAANLQNDLERLMQDAEMAVHRSSNEESRFMLNRARAFQSDGSAAFGISDYLKGQEFYRIAMFYARKAIELSTDSNKRLNRQDYFEEQLRNVEGLLNDALLKRKDNDDLNELIEKAGAFIQKSRDFYNLNQLQRAFAQLQIAERLLFRAIDLSQMNREGEKESIQNNLFSLQRYLVGIELSLQEETDSNAKGLLQKANQLYRDAQDDLENNRLNEARRNMLLSQRLATRTLRLINPSGDTAYTRVNERIGEISTIIQLQKQNPASRDNPVILFLQKEAENLLLQAEKEYEKGHGMQSFQFVRLALNLVNRADQLLRAEKQEHKSSSDLQAWFQDLYSKLTRIAENPQSTEQIKIRAGLLIDMLNRVQMDVHKSNLALQEEILELVQAQLNTLLRRSNY